MTTQHHAQHHDNTVGWSLATYYYFVGVSIFNIILFTLLLVNMALLAPKYRNALKENRAALIFWLNLIVVAIIEVFVNTSLVQDFDSECIHQDESCKRCTFSGHLHHFLIMVGLVSRLFVILRILETNIQQFPILAYPRKVIIGIKFLFWSLFIGVNSCFIVITHISMRVQILESDTSIQICTVHKHDTHLDNHNIVMGVFAGIFLISHITLCILFIKKVAILYQMIKKKLLISPNSTKTKKGLIMIHAVIKPIIKHTLLVFTITLTHCILVLQQTINPQGFPLYPIESLIVGLCILMMFKFGKGYFKFFCGCVEKPIIKKWMKLESNSIHRRVSKLCAESLPSTASKSSTKSKEKQKEINCINQIQIKLEESSQPSLPQIEENSEFKSTAIPVFCERRFSTGREYFQPESVTRSDVLQAMQEFKI